MVDLAQPFITIITTVETANINNDAQLVPTIVRTEAAKLQNIICQQSTDTSKLLGTIEQLNSNINDLQQHMARDLERTEEKLGAECDNMLGNAIERIKGEKDNQIRLLQIQVAKFRGEEKTDQEFRQEDVKKELQFQNQAYPQNPDQAKQKELKNVECTAAK